MRTVVSIVLVAAVSTACNTGPKKIAPPSGEVAPTVAGSDATSYTTLTEARRAFTRQNGTLTATLEDASWIRLEGSPAEAQKRHRGYFEYGYTSFEIVLHSREYTQPTAETFLLEDSRGARLVGRPISFLGGMKLEDDRWTTRFSLSFEHALTSEVDWIRLTRQRDGSVLEWTFRPSAPAAPTSPIR